MFLTSVFFIVSIIGVQAQRRSTSSSSPLRTAPGYGAYDKPTYFGTLYNKSLVKPVTTPAEAAAKRKPEGSLIAPPPAQNDKKKPYGSR